VAGGLTDPEVEELLAIVAAAGARGLTVLWIEHVVHALVRAVDRLLCLAAAGSSRTARPTRCWPIPRCARRISAPDRRGAGFDGSQHPRPEPQAPVHEAAPAEGVADGAALLSVRGLSVHHGQLRAVADLDLEIAPGETVAVIGANGAGKSTLLSALAGTLRPSAGTIVYQGRDITALPTHRRVAAGICLVPEGRRLFPSLTVEENLLTGAYRRRPGPWDVAAVMDLFPWMREGADRAPPGSPAASSRPSRSAGR